MSINIVNRLGSNTINGRIVATMRDGMTAIDKYVSNGSYYHEIRVVSFTDSSYNHGNFGFISSFDVSFNGYKGFANTSSYSTFQEGASYITNFGTGIKPNDIIGFLLNTDNKKYRLYINGVFIGERDIILNDYSPMIGSWNTNSHMTVEFNIAKSDLMFIPDDVEYVFYSYDEEQLNSARKIILKRDNKFYSILNRKVKQELKMTSNTSPSPYVASASSENSTTYQAWKAFNGLNSYTDAWVTATNVTNAWVQIDLGLGNEISIDSFSVTSRNYNGESTLLQYAPKDFNLLASNDGLTFSTLAEIKGQSNWKSVEKRFFNASTKGKRYRYYRLHVLSINGGNLINLGALDLYKNTVQEIPKVNVKNFLDYGVDSPIIANGTFSNKNYILQDGINTDSDGLWKVELNRKPLTIKFNFEGSK